MNQKRIWWILAIVVVCIAYIPYGFVTSDETDPFLCPDPDLDLQNLNFPPSVNIGSEFTFTLSVTNTGYFTSEETEIQIMLPNFVIMTLPDTIPPLEPGESIEITITITIPPDASIGNGLFQVILNPENLNPECSNTNNNLSNTLLILPPGMTPEEYEMLTNPGPFTKITELNRDTTPAPIPAN